MRCANLSLSRSRMSAAFSIRWPRTAKGVLRSALNVLTASCTFFSISVSDIAGNVLINSPVAGFVVAIAMMIPLSMNGHNTIPPHVLHVPEAAFAADEFSKSTTHAPHDGVRNYEPQGTRSITKGKQAFFVRLVSLCN